MTIASSETTTPLLVQARQELQSAEREASEAQRALEEYDVRHRQAQQATLRAKRQVQHAHGQEATAQAQAELDAALEREVEFRSPTAAERFAAARSRLKEAPQAVELARSRLMLLEVEARNARASINGTEAKVREVRARQAELQAEIDRFENSVLPRLQSQLSTAEWNLERLTGERADAA